MVIWPSQFQAVLVAAAAGGGQITIEFELEEVPTPEDLRAALRLAREVDPRVSSIERHPNYGDPNAKSKITVRLGVLDPDPPPFLEQFPIPLLPIPPR